MKKTMASVIADHVRSYDDPIRVRRGDPVTLTGRTDTWDGHRWLWAIAGNGRSGWIPDDLVDRSANPPAAQRDYSAIELTCDRDEDLEVLERSHGWAWCRDDLGRQGWVPLRNLRLRGGK